MAFEKLLEEMGRLSQSFVHGILRQGGKKEASINHVKKPKLNKEAIIIVYCLTQQ